MADAHDEARVDDARGQCLVRAQYVELLVSKGQTCVGRGTVPLVFVVLWPGRGTWAGREGGWYSLPARMERGPMIASVGMIRMMVSTPLAGTMRGTTPAR